MPLNARTTALEALQAAGSRPLAGRTAIVTGATSGIGTETARVLAIGGADVVMAVRNRAAGEALAAKLQAAGGGKLSVEALELGDLASVRAFVERWRASGRPLDLLVNNAGIMATPEGRTAQGFELQVGTNHLGHFALTTGLLPILTQSKAGRVVALTSDLHKRGRGERLVAALEKKSTARYVPFDAYGDSKLANVLMAKALAKRLPTHVEAFSVHPGVIPTNLTRSMGVVGAIFRMVGGLFMKSIPQGAATSVYGATSPELKGKSGAYLVDCHVDEASAEGSDSALAERVWALSEAAIAS